MDAFDSAFYGFRNDARELGTSSPNYPRSFLRNVLPIPCHSHNDYWRTTPLYSALGTGCISVEADVWIVDEVTYVGHTDSDLDRSVNGTLEKLYINPLIEILEARNFARTSENHRPFNGVFAVEPTQSLTLLIDIKSEGYQTWPLVSKALEPLRQRGWLEYWNGEERVPGPITVVGTGNTPFASVMENDTYRDMFMDAPLDMLESDEDRPGSKEYKFNRSNSHYASTRLSKAVGMVGPKLSPGQTEILRTQIRQAHERGLLPRYWGTPRWPRGLRDQIWEVLVKENIGLLNVDDLRAVRKGHWGVWPHQ
ncbi:hypothetical protein K490DRAFT_44386 [Saccharata proteae CBS 121410]|uniref:Altered inheritance of mitochondria protein 6 n=1 Tax=Saccharata proteae CBS 121410 TaxID=1314787 RepID=A0A9P4LWJ6_9PEZI|nr:hypothetical protein K490DRAFT_44386 [Saccharata proteae CBS 121410]